LHFLARLSPLKLRFPGFLKPGCVARVRATLAGAALAQSGNRLAIHGRQAFVRDQKN
jgi:hypothetical protein